MTAAPSTLDTRLELQALAERQAAAVALLRHPLLHAAGSMAGRKTAELLALVQKHEEPLRRWFLDHPGWPLRVTRESARLTKLRPRGGAATAPRGLVDATGGRAFDRRRYALLLLLLAALEQAEDQTLVSTLAEKLVSLAMNDPRLEGSGLRLDLTERADRDDIVHGLRFLTRAGVLERVDGDENRFVQSRDGDALYNVHRGAAAAIVAPRVSPSLAEVLPQDGEPLLLARLRAVADEPEPPAERPGEAATDLRRNLYRRLLDDPVLYLDDLSAAERAYFTSQRPHVLGRIAEMTGLTAEVRAEGVALLDEDGSATDARLPRESPEGHVTLLLAEHLSGLAAAGRTRVGRAALAVKTAELVKTYGRHWRRAAREPGSEAWLTDAAIDLLAGLDLVRPSADGTEIESRPAIARYRVGEVQNLLPGGGGG